MESKKSFFSEFEGIRGIGGKFPLVISAKISPIVCEPLVFPAEDLCFALKSPAAQTAAAFLAMH